jgi:hypothetical protein
MLRQSMIVVVLIGAALAPVPSAPAAEKVEMAPFAMPPLAPPDATVDLRRLFAGPRGAELPPVRVEGGHFVAGRERVRFWGVNLCFAACFPEHDVADQLAARLAAFGVNCVRFHHMDNQSFPNGIWKKDFSGLSPEALDRLDYLLAALKREGIYANLNLHVSRDFSKTGANIPAGDLGTFGKAVCIFDPVLIELQKSYARDLLTHVNPYTKLRLADDPVVGLVEISNENSVTMLYVRWAVEKLSPRYETMLVERWNQWLAARYKTDDALRAAWAAGAEPRGTEMLRGGNFAAATLDPAWQLEQHQGAAMAASLDQGAVKLTVTRVTGTSWHLQFRHSGIKLTKGRTYTLRFRARSEPQREIGVGLQQDHEPYAMLGLSQQVRLKPEWQSVSLSFVASGDEDRGKLTFSVGQAVGAVWLEDISLTPGGRDGLRADESPAKGTVRRLVNDEAVTEGRAADFMRFLTETDLAYFTGLRTFLRDELGVRCPITGTAGFTLLSDYAQSHLDFVDSHAYWQHPHFPNRPWDSRDWTIGNTPMVDEPARSTLLGLTMQRVARPNADAERRPFTVTEYNHPAPSDYQAECVPMVASFAAAQDWDGVFLFAYSHSRDWTEEAPRSFFDLGHNPVKMTQMIAGALLFRRADIAPLPVETVTNIPPETLYRLAGRVGPWNREIVEAKELGATPQMRFVGRYAIAPYPAEKSRSSPTTFLFAPDTVPAGEMLELLKAVDPQAVAPKEAVAWKSSGDILVWSANGKRSGLYTASGERSVAVVGFAAGKPQRIGPVEMTIESPAFAAVTVSSLDGQPLTESRRLLVTACARTENTGQKWNEARTSVGDQWGRAPVLIEPVRATITLTRAVAGGKGSATLIPLDGSGKPAASVPAEKRDDGSLRVRLGDGTATLWYIVDIE